MMIENSNLSHFIYRKDPVAYFLAPKNLFCPSNGPVGTNRHKLGYKRVPFSSKGLA